MKTAVSLPTPLFEAAESLAKRMKVSRSKLYAEAINRFVQAHRGESITDALNRVYANESSTLDPVLGQLQTATLSDEKW